MVYPKVDVTSADDGASTGGGSVPPQPSFPVLERTVLAR
ncbi:MAG: hypothetical protein QOC74_2113, partial [Pseudonocardiales bacterium]|nr:hypothetical protein [Pseudonocardiales bacterium]